jgi:hypothetical protein
VVLKGILFTAGMALAAETPAVAFYAGREVRTATDGIIPYGDSRCVLKREVAEGGARIVETTTQPGPSPSMPPLVSVRVLTRRGPSLIYDAVENQGCFRGIVIFLSASMDQWRTILRRKGGGSLNGTGDLTGMGLRLHATLTLPKDAMFLDGTLTAVPAEEYERVEAAMHPPAGAE